MFTSRCAGCTETVGDGPECSICKKTFHFSCGGISERGFARLGSGRASWMCTTCRDVSQAGLETSNVEAATVNTPGCSKYSSGLPLEIHKASTSTPKQAGNEQGEQNSPILALLTEISSKIATMQTEMKRINVIQQDLQQVKSDVADLKNVINARLDQLTTRVDDIELRVSAVEGLRTDLDEVKAQVRSMLEEGYKNEQ